jgi:hypothetical protein
MGQQSQHCEDNYSTKSNPYVQCNLNENANDILHQDRKVNLKVHMEALKT